MKLESAVAPYVIHIGIRIYSFDDYAPVHSFVVVHRDDQVLSFRSGKFRPQTDPIHGMRSIGFGAAVLATDSDMLYDSFFGIIASAVSDLVYGLGLAPCPPTSVPTAATRCC